MYHYVESGLPNQYLLNGYKTVETPYGAATIIENVETLHKAIASWLVENKPTIAPAEFRFIRKFLNLTQESLSFLAGVDAQTVRRWEHDAVTQWGDRIIRYAFRDYTQGKKPIVGLIETLQALDQQNNAGGNVQWRVKKPRGKKKTWEPVVQAA